MFAQGLASIKSVHKRIDSFLERILGAPVVGDDGDWTILRVSTTARPYVPYTWFLIIFWKNGYMLLT